MGRHVGLYGPRYASEPSDPKIDTVARILGIHRIQAYGHISAFRAQIMVKTTDGRIGGSPIRVVEWCAEWDGTPGALAHAFREADLVRILDDGTWIDPRFMDYQGAAIRAASSASARAKKARAERSAREADAERNASSVTQVRNASSVTQVRNASSVLVPYLLTHSLTPDPDPDPNQDAGCQVAPTEPPKPARKASPWDPYEHVRPKTLEDLLSRDGNGAPHKPGGETMRAFLRRKAPGLESDEDLDLALKAAWQHYEHQGWPQWPHKTIAALVRWCLREGAEVNRSRGAEKSANRQTRHDTRTRQPSAGERVIDGMILPPVLDTRADYGDPPD